MPDTSTITSMEQWLDLVESQLSELSEGQIIEGVITHITPNEILVDIGAKQEGIVPLSDIEWVDESVKANIKEGATVRAYVMRTFEDDEPPLLSIARAAQEKDWQWLENLSDDELVEGRVAEVNKGGLIVYVGMVRGFVPASHVVSVNTKVPDRQAVLRQLLGKTLTLKVLEADSQDNRLILSEREAKQEELQRRKRHMLESLQVGDVLRGRITNVVDFGAFVDLDGVDGMIHISELSWDRIEHPSEVVKVGDELDVYVLKIDHKRERIGLSLKRLHPEPWEQLVEKYQVGDEVDVIITRLAEFGAFARLVDLPVEGLIHISELADGHVAQPQDVVQEGQQVRARIVRIESDRKRLGLSLASQANSVINDEQSDITQPEDEETNETQ